MTDHEAIRTLVKSPPELWAECSDAGSLARHLDPFGEIRITRLEPETAVAWEGEHASGTVRLEPSGWGTRVTLTAEAVPVPSEPAGVSERTPAAPPARASELQPDSSHGPETASEPEAPKARPGFFPRLFGRFGGRRPVAPEPVEPDHVPTASGPTPSDPAVPGTGAGAAPDVRAPAPAPDDAAARDVDPSAALTAALDSLGQAHHRPFSRA